MECSCPNQRCADIGKHRARLQNLNSAGRANRPCAVHWFAQKFIIGHNTLPVLEFGTGRVFGEIAVPVKMSPCVQASTAVLAGFRPHCGCLGIGPACRALMLQVKRRGKSNKNFSVFYVSARGKLINEPAKKICAKGKKLA